MRRKNRHEHTRKYTKGLKLNIYNNAYFYDTYSLNTKVEQIRRVFLIKSKILLKLYEEDQ